eukprot:PLAT3948.1.p1 GENE.PLAT3948.1~~PLAT3948.1.p1  ORF type:complete len:505 (+),score=86.47 PLAT3948.1:75-1517(+)
MLMRLPDRHRSSHDEESPSGASHSASKTVGAMPLAYSVEQTRALAAFEESWPMSVLRFVSMAAAGVITMLVVYAAPAPKLGEQAMQHLGVAAAITWLVSYVLCAWMVVTWSRTIACVHYNYKAMAAMALAAATTGIGALLVVDRVFGIYPVPFASVCVGAPSMVVLLLVAFWWLPAESRANKARMRLLLLSWAMLFWVVICLMLWVLFRALFNSLTGVAQALSVMLMPVMRFASLRVLEAMSNHAAPDGSLDAPASFPLKHYNSFFAASLYGNASGFASILLVVQELLGTSGYLLKMSNAWPRLYAWLTCKKNAVQPMAYESLSSIESLSVDGADWRHAALYGKRPPSQEFRRMLRTSGFLAMEEVVENLVAFQWLALLSFFFLSYQKDAMYVIGSMTDAEFNHSVQFLLISALAEVVMLVIASVLCRRRFGVSLIHHSAFILKEHAAYLLSSQAFLLLFTISLFFKYNGFGALLAPVGS